MKSQHRSALSAGWALFVLFAAAGMITSTPQVTAAGGISGASAFQQMTKLAGEWTGTSQSPSGISASVAYKVTSAGKTVMETLFPGTDHEMVSMYHMDGPALVMTHYCSQGNQPRLRLNEEKSTPTEFVFEFAGGTNLDPAKDSHIHGLILRIKGEDLLEAQWTSYKDGKQSEGLTYQITRKK